MRESENESKYNYYIIIIIDLLTVSSCFLIPIDIEVVLAGKHIPNAIKYSGKRKKFEGYESGNLERIVSIVTNRRVYNFECFDLPELKDFYCMVEAVIGVSLERF